MQQQTSSLSVHDDEREVIDLAGTMHNVMMSPELLGRIDPDDIYGEAATGDASVVHETAGQPVKALSCTCIVTMDDKRERSGTVLSFIKSPTRCEVQTIMAHGAADDVIVERIAAVSVLTSSGRSVFDCEFDLADPHDAPSIVYTAVQDGALLNIIFDVSNDNYNE